MSECVRDEREAVRGERFSEESHFICERKKKRKKKKRNCVLACSLHKTSFRLISSNLILFTSDLTCAELQMRMHWRNGSL